MKPPIPTQPVEKKTNSRASRLLPMGVALLGVLVLAGLVAYQDWTIPAPSVNGAAAAGGGNPTGAYMGHWWGDGIDGFGGSLNPEELLRMMPSDEPMDGEPADLPAYAKKGDEPTPERLAGFRRAANGIVEELASWRIPRAPVDRVEKFYREAAIGRGFVLVPPSPHHVSPSYGMGPEGSFPPMSSAGSTGPVRPTTRPAGTGWQRNSQLFIRTMKSDNAADAHRTEMLVVRLWEEEPDNVHVLLWYRYPTYNHHAPGTVDFGATTQP